MVSEMLLHCSKERLCNFMFFYIVSPMYSSLGVWLLIALAMATRTQADNGMHMPDNMEIVYAYCAACSDVSTYW